MLSARQTIHVAAAPRDVLGHVCDLRVYSLLDRKIVRVYEASAVGTDGNGSMVIRASMRGVRSPRLRLSLRLERWNSVTFTSCGPWLTNRLMWMQGRFTAEPFGGGSFVTHTYRFRFKGPWGPLIERYFSGWLQRDVDDELRRLKAHFDRQAAGLPPLDEPDRTGGEQQPGSRAGAWKDFVGGAEG